MSGTGPSRLWKWLGGAALLAVVLALGAAALVAWVVPGMAKREASKGFEQATGRKLAIGDISIHPFTWNVEIRDLSMSEVGGTGTFASFKRAEATVGLSSLWKGAPVISKVRLEEPKFNVIRTGPNTYNLSDLLKYLMVPVPSIQLNDVAITGGTIDFHDRALPKEELHTIRNGELIVPFLTTIPDQASEVGNPRFSAVIDGAPLVIEAKVRGLPRAAEVSAEVDLRDLSLPVYLAYVPAEIPVKVESGKVAVKGTASYRISKEHGGEAGWDGSVTLTEIKLAEQGGPARLTVDSVTARSRATSGEKRGLLLEDGSLEIRKVSMPFGGKDGLSLGLLAFQGASYSEKKNQLELTAVLLDDGHVRISRDRKGTFSPQVIADGFVRKLPRSRPAAAAPPMQFRIGKVEGEGINIAFTDGTRKELPAFSVTGAHFLAQDVTGPGFGRMPFEFNARFGKDTKIRAKGWAIPTPLAVDAKIQIQGFDLASAGPYVNDDVQIVVVGGRFDATLAAKLETRRDKLGGTFQGSAAIRSLEVLDRKNGKLLAWEALTIDGLQGRVDPIKVQVGKVALAGLRANIVMDPDGNSNLPGGKASRDAAAKVPGASDAKQVQRGKQGALVEELRIDDFHLTRGTIDFTDKGVPGDFKAQVRDVEVHLTGMSTVPGTMADLRARLVMPKGAPLTITGKAAPLKEPAYADMDLVLDKLDLTTATPYAATFLGLEVDKGTLTVKSRAKIEKGNIAAENRIWVEQLTYGKPVKSDKATILPVRLLTDILRNKDGDIVMVLPVAARTDDEDLVGTIVLQVAKDVVFPPGSPLRSIPFDGCSAELTTDAQDRLRKLADALQERQAMKIVAIGYADRELDDKACVARLAAEREKVIASATSKPPQGPIVAAPPVQAPPTFLSLDGEARLQQIAASRAETVRVFLVGEGKVGPPRVVAKAGDIHAVPTKKGDARPRVEFARQGD
jgi:uncharacterized protein involved in outer membrane biogenesis